MYIGALFCFVVYNKRTVSASLTIGERRLTMKKKTSGDGMLGLLIAIGIFLVLLYCALPIIIEDFREAWKPEYIQFRLNVEEFFQTEE